MTFIYSGRKTERERGRRKEEGAIGRERGRGWVYMRERLTDRDGEIERSDNLQYCAKGIRH